MRVLLVLALVFAAACGASPQQQAADGRDRAGSWAATVAAVTDAWSRDLVPSRHVRDTLDAASKDVEAQARDLRTAAGDSAAAPLDAVMRELPRIQDAVARGDRETARTAAANLTRAVPPPPAPPSVQGVR